jgi:TolB protein
MNRFFKASALSIGFLLLIFSIPDQCLADYDYINISNPFLNKIPTAIPVFKSMSNSAAEKEIALQSSDLMTQSLDFTGYFKMIDRLAFLEDIQEKGIEAIQLNFKNWTDIGAELLITGGITLEDDTLGMEFRLMDTYKGQLLYGRRYKGSIEDQRIMVRRFCSDIIYFLTGKRGLFESKIAFVSTTTGNKEIYVADFDGYNPQRITQTKSITLAPAWSPDGSSIAFTSYQKGKPDIYIHNLSKNRDSIIAYKGINITPAFVPGKDLIAATLSFEGDEDIYLLNDSGKVVDKLTDSFGIDVSPTFSPDGKRMAFVSRRQGSPQIYIQDLDGGNVQRLTYDGSYNTEPNWSPTGDRIVYSGMKGGLIDIFVIEISTGRASQLTYNSGRNETPCWSPDGSLIAFASNRQGKSKIYFMTASGTDQKNLLDLPGEQSSPAWSPPFGDN